MAPQYFCSTFTEAIINSTGNFFPHGTPKAVINQWNLKNDFNTQLDSWDRR